jgi:Uma2 family endonuclease
MAVERARRRFTVAEYDRLIEAGFFGPDERLELVDGELVTMTPPWRAPRRLRRAIE